MGQRNLPDLGCEYGHGGGYVPMITVSSEYEDSVLYLCRKLTPTECASLQGFPKDWCALVPHKDTPEYKMWGNGMALPCVLYVMEGMADVVKRRALQKILGGDDVKSHS